MGSSRIVFLLCIITNLLHQNSFGQPLSQYNELTKEASNLYTSKEYLQSGKKYSEAFAALNNRGRLTDRHNAACSYALASEIDSSFAQLFKIANGGNYKNLKKIRKEKDLKKLHSDKRWQEVLQIVSNNKEQAEKLYDKALIKKLEKVLRDDQKYRTQLIKIEKKQGRDSKKAKTILKRMHKKDSINLIIVEDILNNRGWLGKEIAGKQGNITLFLVIQHSNLTTQIKYLPLMREAVDSGKAYPNDLALLEDRVAIGQGKKQIYGSQISFNSKTGKHFVSPIIEPEKVNERRAKVGLAPIEDYLKHWEIKWDLEEHQKEE